VIDQSVRLHIYGEFIQSGEPPTVVETALVLGQSETNVAAAYDRLAAGRVIVLRPGTREVLMAAPFSAVPTRFTVQVASGRSYYGNCIWDALGIPAMLGRDAVIQAACGDCDAPLTLEVRANTLTRSEGTVHFALPASKWWENIVFT
jgi:hypothetical protein